MATRVLHRVAVDGAWASRALDAELDRARLDPRDAALATAIVYGVLRVLPELDARIDALVSRRPDKMDPWVRAALRAAAFQLAHLARVPAHAVVDETVQLVRNERGPRLGGFANAILRKLSVARPETLAPPARLVVPDWVRTVLFESLGEERANALLGARAVPPPIDLRVLRGSRDDLAAVIRLAHPEAEVTFGQLSDQCLRVRHAGDPRKLPGFEDGAFVVQDEGAQVLGMLTGALPGEHVADACAGRGGKTAQLAAAVGRAGRLTAIDVNEGRLEQIPGLLARLGLDVPLEIEPVDLTVGTAGLDGAFDRVLVDAPCTGLGTLHRRPEILLRLTRADVDRLADTQRQILANAAALLRPGGILVYAVCSPTSAEGAEVLDVAKDHGLVPANEAWSHSIPVDPDGIVRLGPWMPGADAGCDAYQIAKLRRIDIEDPAKVNSRVDGSHDAS